MSGSCDLIDKARHWLIRKLACGDFIMINFELRDDGLIDKRNLGPALIADSVVSAPDGISAVSIGSRKKHGLLNFRITSIARFINIRMISPTHWGIVEPKAYRFIPKTATDEEKADRNCWSVMVKKPSQFWIDNFIVEELF